VNDPLLKKVKLKSLEDIIARARDIISRHRRRFISRSLRPCPENCAMAEMMGRKITGCSGCDSIDPNKCIRPDKFKPVFSKEQLAEQFAQELRDPGVLLRDYRDVVVFYWILGAFDKERVDEEIVANVEKRREPVNRNDEAQPKDVQNHNPAGRPRTSVLPRDSDNSEPNYNRAESNYSSVDARLSRRAQGTK
jgi:hypothetical protein